MKILIIEDDDALCEVLRKSLERERFIVETAHNYATGIMKSMVYQYDCILLDIMLPDGNGLALLEKLKAEQHEGSIIIISARDSIDDKITGLNLGADDYLPKPFHLAELNARIRSVLRRKQAGSKNMIQCDNIALLPEEYRVLVDGQAVELTRKEYDILHYFVNRPNRLLSKEQIAEAAWGDNIDQADNFDFIYTQIKNLRRKLIAARATPEIKAVYGLGNKFTTNIMP